MKNLRLLDQPADFERFNLNPNQVELWEDGRRNTAKKGAWEWWYFDALLDDGSQLVIQFFPKAPRNPQVADLPMYHYTLTLPDGRILDKKPEYATNTSFSKERCDVHYGQSKFVGDFKDYDIVADSTDTDDGFGANIHLHSLSKPYRPATGIWETEDQDEYTWFCAVPRGTVEGTVTYDGETHQVTGTGYHDHQWGSISYAYLWNHWTWARQNFADYSLLVFDMTAAKSFGYKRYPICFLQDGQGNVVFESRSMADYQVLKSQLDVETGKNYPVEQAYVFKAGENTLSYDLVQRQLIENQTMTKLMPKPMQQVLKLKGINMTYQRYVAEGTMSLKRPGNPDIVRADHLIYEFMYPGATNFDEAHA